MSNDVPENDFPTNRSLQPLDLTTVPKDFDVDAYAESLRVQCEHHIRLGNFPYIEPGKLLALLDAYSEACVDRDDAEQALAQIATLLRPVMQPYVQLVALLNAVT